MDLSIIIVSWNVRALLAQCLTALQASLAQAALQGEIIVIDNASSDQSAAMVRECFPDVILVETGANLGYTGGNNLGLGRAQGEFILILNPDTAVAPEALGRLVAFLKGHPTVGLVGPALCNPDGTHQASRRRFPSLLVGLIESTSLQPHLAWLPPLKRFVMADQPADQPHPVDWLVGAALLVRREVVEMVGRFDDDFFMYFEELDWQRRMKAAGWSIWYLPTAQVVHHEGASSGQIVARRHMLFATSKIHYYRKWFGPRTAQGLRAWLLALCAWELAIESLKLLVGHKRALRSARVAAYRQVLASGLSQAAR